MGRFQSHYQSGRGRGQKSNPNKNSNNAVAKTKKSLTNYTFYLGSAKQASNYKTAMDFIINHMKKTYKYGSNIAVAIREGAKAATNI